MMVSLVVVLFVGLVFSGFLFLRWVCHRAFYISILVGH
jgi:hypothetical protein